MRVKPSEIPTPRLDVDRARITSALKARGIETINVATDMPYSEIWGVRMDRKTIDKILALLKPET